MEFIIFLNRLYARRKIFLLVSIFFFCLFPLYSQSSADGSDDYLLPAAEVFGLNIFVWSIDRYVANEEWARISFDSITTNITHGFVWDSDGFETNQFFHPYSGALSFTAARSSGLNFWQSLIYPFAGSLMWELSMETEYPSINDIITTPMSGIVLGEISYRISNLIFYSGMNDFWRNATSAVVSPMNGFNRLIGKTRDEKKGRQPEPPYSVALSAGLNGILFDGEYSRKQPHFFFNYHMDYGSYINLDDGYQPFDYFKTDAGLILSDNNNIVTIFASGLLFGKYIYNDTNWNGIAGVFKSFNFLENSVYKISASSIGAGILTRHFLGTNLIWNNLFIASVVVMGGIDSPYAEVTNRDYNLGPGMSAKINSSFCANNFVELYLLYKFYWLHSLSGARGNDYTDIIKVGSRLNITKHHAVSLEIIKYGRWSHYTDYPDLRASNFSIRLYYTVSFQHKTI